MLYLKNITILRGKKTIINDSTMDVLPGEVVALIGENGAGKTTLLHFIAGILKSISGNVYYEDEKIDMNSEEWKRMLSFVLDNGGTIPLLTVEEQIILQCLLLGVSQTKSKKRANYVIDLLRLNKHRKYRGDELSSGFRKRLGIGLGLVRDAKIFLFDEPLSSLDFETVSIFLDIIKLLKKRNRIVIIATHSLSSLNTIYDRIWALSSNTVKSYSNMNDLDSFSQHNNVNNALYENREIDVPWIK